MSKISTRVAGLEADALLGGSLPATPWADRHSAFLTNLEFTEASRATSPAVTPPDLGLPFPQPDMEEEKQDRDDEQTNVEQDQLS